MNRLGGVRRDPNPVRLHVARVHVPLSLVVAGWMTRKIGLLAGALVRWVARYPWLLAPVVPWWALTRLLHDDGGEAGGPGVRVVGALMLAALLALLLVLVGWRVRWPESFTRHVAGRVRGVWRRVRVYRFCWQPAMVTTGLAVTLEAREYLPKILAVRSTGAVDRVRVRMLPGQVVEDWTTAGPRLAQTFDALDCRVRSVAGRRQEVELWFLITDPLTTPVPPFAAEQLDDPPKLDALPVALREDGLTYRLRLLGTHLLVVGATGSGKSSVLWSLLAALGPGIRDGLVRVWCLDPKGGMELAPGRRLFARFVYGDPDTTPTSSSGCGVGLNGGGGAGVDYEAEFATVLEDAVTVMRRRQSALRGRARLHTPTVGEPLIVVVVDELASLTAYVTDREAKRRIGAALALLLSQGRAVGVTVVGAVQDPRKEILTVRDLFPTRIALRVAEPEHVGLVLGPGARDRGARCDQIPETLPGIGYVGADGVAEPVRVRFTHLTDPDIDQLAREYAPRSRTLAALDSTRRGGRPGDAFDGLDGLAGIDGGSAA